MAYPTYLKAKARQLRQERQMTLDELVERLALPKTTIWYWIQDLPLTRLEPSPGQTAARRNGNLAMQRRYRMLREAAYEEGCRSFPELSTDPTFRDFVCLYIAEGYKRSRNAVAICNSDPGVVKLATAWIGCLSSRPVTGSLQYHADQDPQDLRQFWAGATGIPVERVGLQRKSNSSQLRKRTWRCKYGVLQVRVGDTLLRSRLQAWMDCLQSQWPNPHADEGVLATDALRGDERHRV